jgi:hypothetical protein
MMIMDNAKELTGGEFRLKCQQAGCYSREIEPYLPWMNHAEGTIHELKQATRCTMVRHKWITQATLGLLS